MLPALGGRQIQSTRRFLSEIEITFTKYLLCARHYTSTINAILFHLYKSRNCSSLVQTRKQAQSRDVIGQNYSQLVTELELETGIFWLQKPSFH